MPLSLIEGALGGVGLFLLGMRFMSDSIRSSADDRAKHALSLLISNRYLSCLFGLFMALAINSGNAAVLFTFGLFNGGVLNVFQAICVLAGVLLGVSLSVHVTFIPYSLLAGPLILGGVLARLFSRSRRRVHGATLLMGIGLLFFGLSLMESSFLPVYHHPFYEIGPDLLNKSSIIATLLGALVSFLVQSAQSSVHSIASLVQDRSLTSATSFAMIFGSLTGTAVMALFAAVDGKTGARRIAVLMIMVTGVVNLFYVIFSDYVVDLSSFLSSLFSHHDAVSDLAWGYSLSSLCVAAILFLIAGPVSRRLRKLDVSLSNSSGVTLACTGFLDRRILSTPPIALEQARKTIIHMAGVVASMYSDVNMILSNFDPRRVDAIRQHEQNLDSLSHEITAFLAGLSNSSSSPEIMYEVPGLIQVVSTLEHIGDTSEDILNCTLARKESGVVFSNEAMAELLAFAAIISPVIEQTQRKISTGRIYTRSELQNSRSKITEYHEEIQRSHFTRICSGTCPPRSALLFQEIVSSCMRIAELCWTVMRMPLRRQE